MRLPIRHIWRGLRIRLSRSGCANRPFYQIVAVDKHRGPKTEDIHEQLGSLDPMPNANGEVLCAINYEGVRKWMAKGATLSKPVEKLFGLSGFLPIHHMTFITARRIRINPDAARENQYDESEQTSEP